MRVAAGMSPNGNQPGCSTCSLGSGGFKWPRRCERLTQHLWDHGDDLFTFLRQPGLDATNWRTELAIRFGVILSKVWGGSRTWAGARAQSILMSVWRTCWQQGRSAVNFLS